MVTYCEYIYSCFMEKFVSLNLLALLVLQAGTVTVKGKQSVDFVCRAMVGGKPETKQGS